jgi:nicotinamidase-related amidase
VDKKSFDRKIERWTRHDAAAGRAMAQRVYGVALPNMIRLVEFFRRVRRPVVFVQWGWHRFQYPPLEPLPGEDVVVKRTRGAFGGSNLDDVLKRRGVTAGVFAGADTALCVASTVRGAIDAGYRAVLVEDACVSALSRLHEATVETLGYLQAVVLRTDEVLALERPTPA